MFKFPEDLLISRNNKKHFWFHTNSIPLFDWNDVVSCLEYNVKNKIPIKSLENFGIVLHDTSCIKITDYILSSYSKLDPQVSCSSHLYISMSSESKTFGWHKDVSDVLFWQVVGETIFSVQEENKHTYILKPNDFLYIPRGVMHNTQPNSPRAGVSFGLDYTK